MKEEDLRPQHIFDKFLELAKEDTQNYFNECDRENISCPACNNIGQISFTKNGFDYHECSECFTLYVNPRPIEEAFERYYTESPSVEYWATTFYKETEASRRKLLWKPKARTIKESIDQWICSNEMYTVIDIGGGYGIFAEEMKLISKSDQLIIEPSPKLAEICRKKGFSVVQKFLESVSIKDLPDSQKVFVSFELFEHLHSPEVFLNNLIKLMSDQDLFIFTTLSGTGVDISTLWENSKSVSPPHHLNFFNPKSIPILLKRCNLEVLDITTPGKLDLDIMSNNIDFIQDRFWKQFIQMSSDQDKEIMQKALQDTCSSSHIMVICKAVN